MKRAEVEAILAGFPESGCWEWPLRRDRDGYGALYWSAPNVRAHRVVYELLVGPIPEGLQIDHLCRNRACVNPAHLEPVTSAENTRRGWRAQKKKCVNGHPYDEANTYIRPTGQRDCRACGRDRARRYIERLEAA